MMTEFGKEAFFFQFVPKSYNLHIFSCLFFLFKVFFLTQNLLKCMILSIFEGSQCHQQLMFGSFYAFTSNLTQMTSLPSLKCQYLYHQYCSEDTCIKPPLDQCIDIHHCAYFYLQENPIKGAQLLTEILTY